MSTPTDLLIKSIYATRSNEMSVLRQFKLKLFSVSVESNPMNDVVGWASFAMADWMNSNYFVIGNWKVKKKKIIDPVQQS